MTQLINEAKRFQKLAGLINESQLNEETLLPGEKEIVNAILSENINEEKLTPKTVLAKLMAVSKKGLLTASIITSVLASCNFGSTVDQDIQQKLKDQEKIEKMEFEQFQRDIQFKEDIKDLKQEFRQLDSSAKAQTRMTDPSTIDETINKTKRIQKLANIDLKENQDLNELDLKKVAAGAATALALLLGSPDADAQSAREMRRAEKAQELGRNKDKWVKFGKELMNTYLSNPEKSYEWQDSINQGRFRKVNLIQTLGNFNKRNTKDGGYLDNTDYEMLGHFYSEAASPEAIKTAQEFVNFMKGNTTLSKNTPMEENIELAVNEALALLREEETSEELTPDQIAVIQNITKLAEGTEGDDKAKYEKLKSELKKVALTATFVATLITSMSSCTRNGYGCHGRSKIMTRVRENIELAVNEALEKIRLGEIATPPPAPSTKPSPSSTGEKLQGGSMATLITKFKELGIDNPTLSATLNRVKSGAKLTVSDNALLSSILVKMLQTTDDKALMSIFQIFKSIESTK